LGNVNAHLHRKPDRPSVGLVPSPLLKTPAFKKTIMKNRAFLSGPAVSRAQSLFLGAIAILLASQSVRAENLYWDPSGTSAAGNWDGTTANFNSALNGSGSTTAPTLSTSDVFFSTSTTTTGGTVTVSGTQLANSLSFTTAGVTLGGTGTIAFGSGTSSIDVANGVTETISAFITGSNGLTKTGAGTLVLGNTANVGLAGTINIKAGTLTDGSNGTNATNGLPISLGDAAGSADVTFMVNRNQNYTSAITVNAGLGGVKRISGGPTLSVTQTPSITQPITLNAALTIGNGSGGSVGGVALTGVITGSSTITIDGTTAASAVTASGGGTLAFLGGGNGASLTSTINVNNGTLRLNATGAGGTGTINVQGTGGSATASIGGNGGTALGNVIVTNGNSISPGNGNNSNALIGAAGTLGLGVNAGSSLTLTNANLFLDLNTTTTGSDLINTDSLSIGSALAFTFNALGASIISDGVTPYTLINSVNAVTGFNPANISTSFVGTLAGGYTAAYSINGSNDLVATFAAVPEPSACMLLGGVGSLLALRRRRLD
jgi:hypothetical protein